jgi:hypothetical protein
VICKCGVKIKGVAEGRDGLQKHIENFNIIMLQRAEENIVLFNASSDSVVSV